MRPGSVCIPACNRQQQSLDPYLRLNRDHRLALTRRLNQADGRDAKGLVRLCSRPAVYRRGSFQCHRRATPTFHCHARATTRSEKSDHWAFDQNVLSIPTRTLSA